MHILYIYIYIYIYIDDGSLSIIFDIELTLHFPNFFLTGSWDIMQNWPRKFFQGSLLKLKSSFSLILHGGQYRVKEIWKF